MEYAKNSALWCVTFTALYVLHAWLNDVSFLPYVLVWCVVGGIYGLTKHVAHTSSRCVLAAISRGIQLTILASGLWAVYPSQTHTHWILWAMMLFAFVIGAGVQYVYSSRESS